MALLTQDDLRSLIEPHSGPCVSLYIPTETEGRETRENPIRFKNVLQAAQKELEVMELRRAEVEEMLSEAQDLLRDRDFWRHQGTGLATFLARETTSVYRLPLEFEPLTVVGDRFHIKPLLPLFGADGRFYVLAISGNNVRLLECSRWSVRRVEVPGMPADLDEAMRFDVPQKQLQFHTGTGAAGKGSTHAAVFHGQAVGKDDTEDAVREYLRQVDEALHAVLREETAPLVPAGAESVVPLFREMTDYAYVTNEAVDGNPENVSDEELYRKAWPVLEPVLSAAQSEAATRVRQANGKDRGVAKLARALRAADGGRVETLFVDRHMHKWGRFDAESGELETHGEREAGDEDLVDRAAVETLKHGGVVYAVDSDDMPVAGPIAGVLRY